MSLHLARENLWGLENSMQRPDALCVCCLGMNHHGMLRADSFACQRC